MKNYVLARTSPLDRARKTLPSFDQTFSKLRGEHRGLRRVAVKYQDIQRAATFAPPATNEPTS